MTLRRRRPCSQRLLGFALAGIGITLAVSYADYAFRALSPPTTFSYSIAPWSMRPPPSLISFALPSQFELNLPTKPYWIDDESTGESPGIESVYYGYGYPFRSSGTVVRWAIDAPEVGEDDRTWRPRWYFAGVPLARTGLNQPVPLMVFPAGLIANAVFYALAVAAFRRLCGRAVRWRRRAKGCCEVCGYERFGDVCPECGAGLLTPPGAAGPWPGVRRSGRGVRGRGGSRRPC